MNNITLDGFKEFVKSQSGPYEYRNPNCCPFAQYLHSLGYTGVSVSSFSYRVGVVRDTWGLVINNPDRYFLRDIHPGLEDVLNPQTEADSTFEALYERLELLK